MSDWKKYLEPAEFKKCRKALGLSQPRMAVLLGFTSGPRHVFRLEHGTSPIMPASAKLLWVYKMASEQGSSLADMLLEEDEG